MATNTSRIDKTLQLSAWIAIAAAVIGADSLSPTSHVARAQDTPTQTSNSNSTAAPASNDDGLVVNGRVPVSVAVRQQSPEVEAIIKQLEEKAKSGQGTWKLASGKQSEPGKNWSFSTAKEGWALQGDVDGAHPRIELFSDGEETFRLPDRVRFENDKLLQGVGVDAPSMPSEEVGTFPLGTEFLLFVLQPKNVLRCLPGLKVIGQEKVDGRPYIHLQSDPATDSLVTRDSATRSRTVLMPVIDLYYDSVSQSLVKLISSDHAGHCFEVFVSSWDEYGTPYKWPKVLNGLSFASGTIGTGGVIDQIPDGKRIITSIQALEKDETSQLADLQQRVSQIPFFSADPQFLRTSSFLSEVITKFGGNMSDKVALCQSAFSESDMQLGLKTWNDIEGQLPDERERALLATQLIPRAADGLQKILPSTEQVTPALDTMSKILDEGSPAILHRFSAAICIAWEKMFADKESRSVIQKIQPRLFDLFASNGDGYVFSRLSKLSVKKRERAAVATSAR